MVAGGSGAAAWRFPAIHRQLGKWNRQDSAKRRACRVRGRDEPSGIWGEEMWLIVKKILCALAILFLWSVTFTAAGVDSGAAGIIGLFAFFFTIAGAEYIFTGTE